MELFPRSRDPRRLLVRRPDLFLVLARPSNHTCLILLQELNFCSLTCWQIVFMCERLLDIGLEILPSCVWLEVVATHVTPVLPWCRLSGFPTMPGNMAGSNKKNRCVDWWDNNPLSSHVSKKYKKISHWYQVATLFVARATTFVTSVSSSSTFYYNWFIVRCLCCHLPTKRSLYCIRSRPWWKSFISYFCFLTRRCKPGDRCLCHPAAPYPSLTFTSLLTCLFVSSLSPLRFLSRPLLPVHSVCALKWLDVWLSSNCLGTVCRTWWWDDCCCEITNTNRHHLAFSVYSPSVRLKCTILPLWVFTQPLYVIFRQGVQILSWRSSSLKNKY